MTYTICLFCSYLVEAIIVLQYSTNLFPTKNRFRIRLTVLFSLYLLLFVLALFKNEGINLIAYFIINFVFLYTQFHLKWYLSLFHSSIICAITGMCEMIVYVILQLFSPKFYQNKETVLHWIFLAVFSKLILFTVMYVLIQMFHATQKRIVSADKSALLFIFTPITSLQIMLTFVTINENTNLPSSLYDELIISSIGLLFINLLIFGINQHTQTKNSTLLEMKLLLQKEEDTARYQAILCAQNENQRILIHDIKNHLHSMQQLIAENEIEKASVYLKNLIQSSNLKEYVRPSNHDMLNAILYRYQQQCQENSISFHIDIRNSTTSFIEDSDLTSLFCNLLDNAYEAAHMISNGFIDLCIQKIESASIVVITIQNSCRTNPFSRDRNSLLSNKPDSQNHGLGLKSVQKVIQKYHGNIKMYYHDETLTFHTIITLKQ